MQLLQLTRRVAEAPASPWALASIVRTRGSTYRKTGARMLIGADGETLGVLSGGCLEAEVARHARATLAGGQPGLLRYDTRRLFGCEGQLEIFVEALPLGEANPLLQLGRRLELRQPAWLRTRFVAADGGPLGTRLLAEAEPQLREGVLLHDIALPIRLLLLGNGPEIAPLLRQSSGLGWQVVCCPTPDHLPVGLVGDARTAGVIMTHHLGRDCQALARLLPLGLPYLGLLGPRRRQQVLLEQLEMHAGFDTSWLASLYAPAGLDIGSETPAEIALAILAEIAAVFAGRAGGFLRARAGAIHAAARVG